MVEMTWRIERTEDGKATLAATWLSRTEHKVALPLAS
jgi:hypothetical protein